MSGYLILERVNRFLKRVSTDLCKRLEIPRSYLVLVKHFMFLATEGTVVQSLHKQQSNSVVLLLPEWLFQLCWMTLHLSG